MPKERVNLFLERDAIERGRKYGQRHGTSVSKLVSDYLARLPVEEESTPAELTPTVKRLLGIGAGAADRETYRDHLSRKYSA